MARDYGKAFEERFKEDFLKTVPNCSLDRIYDVTFGYKDISNISDFIGYSYPYIFYLECKSHKGASIPFDCITQYKKLTEKVGIPGVRTGVVWLYEKNIVLYVPIATITEIMKTGEKSVGIRHLNKYNIKIVPSVKLRVFMESDYSILLDLKDGE